MLLRRDFLEKNWSAKLEPKWEGPYIVHDQKGLTYALKTLTGEILSHRQHRNRLKKYHKPGELRRLRTTPEVVIPVHGPRT